tara:strand:- start:10094 stop:10213 length:120 start_codon:yes stop_codon:yes gene_type:complete
MLRKTDQQIFRQLLFAVRLPMQKAVAIFFFNHSRSNPRM